MKQVLAHQLPRLGSGKGGKERPSSCLLAICGAGGSQQRLKEKVNLLVNKWLPYCGGGVQIIRGIFG